ncbi:lmo0937 family membrane protein [Clostridium algoriphilum]|uniref:lmo0937 family membrane protein n=1 Tax=Clostridium algoriphilum TaxID=198347 RepID=UPI001CF2163B|nr:lmo0937 family membrane protein [Clostridium algoriphilum]MCB2294520.1 lmo0937 family membrane protein [Clostridium algoriphilum]
MVFLHWVCGILISFWAWGLVFKIGGGMIHMLLVIAVIVFIMAMDSGKGGRAN